MVKLVCCLDNLWAGKGMDWKRRLKHDKHDRLKTLEPCIFTLSIFQDFVFTYLIYATIEFLTNSF